MELLPPSSVVLASLAMKVYSLLSSPISFHSCYKTMSESLGACQVNIELKSYLLNASTQRGHQELEQARKQQTKNAH